MALFSKSAEYAVRAVVWLAHAKSDQPIGNRIIAERTKIPPTFLSKILHQLVEAGILNSRRGAGGGFTLSKVPESITVYDVVHAVDPLERITTCPLGLATHKHRLCPMHAKIDFAINQMEQSLRSTRVTDLLSDPSRPIPMVESESGTRPNQPAEA